MAKPEDAMDGFKLARPEDPRGPYAWLTDDRTPADVGGNSRGYVLAWAFTTIHGGVYDDAERNARIDSQWRRWVGSEDEAAAVRYIQSWVRCAGGPMHPEYLTLDDVAAGFAQVVTCPDCGQMELWTNQEVQDHGLCRASLQPCPVCEAGQ